MGDVKPPRRWKQREDSDRALRAEETRNTIVVAARDLFAERGYHAVGIRDICECAGFSRGTLNHYFREKQALFEAVFALVEDELSAQVSVQLAQKPVGDVWLMFRRSIQFFLDAAATRIDVQRITLIDGPSVLGWAKWRELEEGFSLGAFTMALQAAMDAGRIKKAHPEPLAHLILGSVMEAGLLVANSDKPSLKRKEVGQALDEWLAGLEIPTDR